VRSRLLVWLLLCVPFVVTGAAAPPQVVDLEEVVSRFVEQIPRKDSEGLQLPTTAEAERFTDGLNALRGGDVDRARRLLRPLAYTVSPVEDSVTGRAAWVLRESRNKDGTWPHGWGLYVVAMGPAEPLVVEVPHPLHDVFTPQAGVAAFREGGAEALLVAGTHRYANSDGSSDVAHEPRTMFARVDRAIVGRGRSVVQLHGFGTNVVGAGDVVVSAGEAAPPVPLDPLSDALRAAGFAVCQYDGTQCSQLAGTQNVQGAWSRDVGARFVHLEIARPVRDDPVRRTLLVRVVVDELTR
jgi:hypothetical protein